MEISGTKWAVNYLTGDRIKVFENRCNLTYFKRDVVKNHVSVAKAVPIQKLLKIIRFSSISFIITLFGRNFIGSNGLKKFRLLLS